MIHSKLKDSIREIFMLATHVMSNLIIMYDNFISQVCFIVFKKTAHKAYLFNKYDHAYLSSLPLCVNPTLQSIVVYEMFFIQLICNLTYELM